MLPISHKNRGRTFAEWIPDANTNWEAFYAAFDELFERAIRAPNGPRFNPPDTNRLGPNNSHGIYNSRENTISLFRGNDEFALAEEIKHWEYHQNWLESHGMTQGQFDHLWDNVWSQGDKALYRTGLEHDARTWFESFGFTHA